MSALPVLPRLKHIAYRAVALALLISSQCFATVYAANNEDPTPTLDLGAKVYSQRCVLCHGEQGMGEGILPLKLANYPDTNLLKKNHQKDRAILQQIIVYGGNLKGVNDAMPPYGQELTWTETESVTDFIAFMRASPDKASKMVVTDRKSSLPQTQLGKEVYDTRCVLCHGKYGEGDGRMAKLLKTPPPYDLTASRMPEAYLKQIIAKGGEAMGRSKHMPPWGDQLNEQEIDALIAYLLTIRD